MSDATPDRDRMWREAALWACAALACRLAFLALSPRALDSADSILYLDVARQFASGDFFHFYTRIPPLYPLLTAFVHSAGPSLEWSAIGVSLVASTALAAVVYRVARALHGRPSARFAALLVCLWPWLVDYGCRVAPEALMSLFWFAGWWMLLEGMRRGGWRPAAAALLFFAMHVTRPEGTFLWLAAPFLALAFCRGDASARWRRVLPFLAASAVLLCAYGLYMHAVTGSASVTPRAGLSTLRFVFVDRGMETAKAFLKLFGTVLPVMMGPVLLAFAGVGLFAPSAAPRDRHLEWALLAFAGAQFVLAALSTYAEPRYIMNVAIALSLWSARGAAIVTEHMAASGSWRRVRYAPVVLLVALMGAGLAVNVAPPLLGRMSYQPVEYKMAGLWMKAHLEPGLILCRKPQVGFYAGMPSTGPAPDESLPQIMKRARDAGARYLVVDERYSTRMIPSLEPLLDPAKAPPGLRLLKAGLSPYPRARIVIYAIEGTG